MDEQQTRQKLQCLTETRVQQSYPSANFPKQQTNTFLVLKYLVGVFGSSSVPSQSALLGFLFFYFPVIPMLWLIERAEFISDYVPARRLHTSQCQSNPQQVQIYQEEWLQKRSFLMDIILQLKDISRDCNINGNIS